MISVICCYNKYPEYCNMLDTLRKQSTEFEIIGVDNTNGVFSSAAAALNYGAKMATGSMLVFVHQDILFLNNNSLASFVEPIIQAEGALCIVGLFGAARKNKTYNGYVVKETLDECCVAMHRDTWEQYPFNDVLCDGWHLYVVEQCLRIGSAGGRILSGEFAIKHLSTGNVDDAYMKTFKRLMDNYKEKKWIVTVCKSLPNNSAVFRGYWILWKIKKYFFGNYGLVYSIKTFFRKKDCL